MRIRYRGAVKIVELALLLPFLLAIGVAAHAALSRVLKAVLWLMRLVVAGILLFALGWYLVTKYVRRSRGINVDFAFREIPPE